MFLRNVIYHVYIEGYSLFYMEGYLYCLLPFMMHEEFSNMLICIITKLFKLYVSTCKNIYNLKTVNIL